MWAVRKRWFPSLKFINEKCLACRVKFFHFLISENISSTAKKASTSKLSFASVFQYKILNHGNLSEKRALQRLHLKRYFLKHHIYIIENPSAKETFHQTPYLHYCKLEVKNPITSDRFIPKFMYKLIFENCKKFVLLIRFSKFKNGGGDLSGEIIYNSKWRSRKITTKKEIVVTIKGKLIIKTHQENTNMRPKNPEGLEEK